MTLGDPPTLCTFLRPVDEIPYAWVPCTRTATTTVEDDYCEFPACEDCAARLNRRPF